MSNFNTGPAMSMGLKTENDLAKYARKRSSSKSLAIDIHKLGDSLENAINLEGFPKSEIWHECVSCRDEQLQGDMHKTKCSHFYCKACLIRLFRDSLHDESLFPPQCCHKSIAASEKMLGLALVQKHKEKTIELSDPDRTYCCNPKCAEYLPRKITRNGICKCASCGVRTCRKCKKHAHEGKCVYKLDALLEELAERKKWQRCAKCSRLIELSTGCNHITSLDSHLLGAFASSNFVTFAESRGKHANNIRRGVGICEFFTVRTCTDCKKEGYRSDCTYVNANNHSGAQDEKVNDDLLEKLAKKKWQRCSNCSRIIECVSGCQRIS
ncbi:hypothetical protein N7447_001590 [Penicillium robsamsonii]|uniref:uncharacterized protein n=1 Tax=Penicillium robsamsonii TaxID=1792511 RepID=UPI0025479278|nr:uncharacterized protein N7447_001590 [Penicillium robsamsonii]KAJ5835564.1 hypothetical protein N7447_001590 [Penicillium robsamsonii]